MSDLTPILRFSILDPDSPIPDPDFTALCSPGSAMMSARLVHPRIAINRVIIKTYSNWLW